MKKIFILLFFLIGITNCSNSQNNEIEEKELLKNIPESSVIFASFDTSTPAYQRYMKSPWFFDISEKITKISENEDFLKNIKPSEQENFKRLVNELTQNFKDSGFYPVDGKKPDIKKAVFFLNLENNKTNGGVYALGYDGVDLTSKVDLLKNKLSNSKLFKETIIAGVSGLQLASPQNPILKDFSISAKGNKLALVSNEKLAENYYSTTQKDSKNILTNSIYQSIKNNFPQDDVINTFFVDIPNLLNRFVSYVTENIKNNNIDKINDVNKLDNDKDNDLDLKKLKELIEINPVSSIVSVSSMPNDNNLHNHVLISLNDKVNPILNTLLEPVTERNQSNVIKQLPQDIALFLNIDGSFLSKFIRIAELNPDYQKGPMALSISAYKNLLTSIRSVTLSAKDKENSALITHPSIALILETSSGKEIKENIKISSQMFGAAWLNKEISNHQVDYMTLFNGITFCMSADDNALYITTSEEFLSDIYSDGTKIHDVLPEKTKKNISDKALATTYVSFSQLGSLIENVISELKMYSLGQDVLTEEAISGLKALNEYTSTLSLNKDSIEYEQDYFLKQ